MTRRHDPRSGRPERSAEARRLLDRLGDEAETIGTSSLARTAERARDNLSGDNAEARDPIEIWGTRIGRGLGLVFAVVLAVYLAVRYVF